MARGRRKLTAEEPGRNVRVFSSVTPSEKAAIIQEARRHGLTVSDFLRDLALRRIAVTRVAEMVAP